MKLSFLVLVERTALNLAKKVQRFLHASPDGTIGFLKDAETSSTTMEEANRKVHAACNICSSRGRPKDKRMLSLGHVIEVFYVKIQTNFTVDYNGNDEYEILNIVITGTGYGERAITTSRSFENIHKLLELTWINPQEVSRALSADLERYKIKVHHRSSRTSRKNGKILGKQRNIQACVR